MLLRFGAVQFGLTKGQGAQGGGLLDHAFGFRPKRQIADFGNRHPEGFRRVVAGNRFAGLPLGGEIDQGVVELCATGHIAVDHVHDIDQMGNLDRYTGFFQHLPFRGLANGLAEILAAGSANKSLGDILCFLWGTGVSEQ